jgi:hypothetical protein
LVETPGFPAGQGTGRDLIEMVVYAGLPPAIPAWQDERDKKNKFVHWLRSNGFMVVTKDGAPAEEGRYNANVDVMMAIDALELSIEMRPDVVILVTGDADFAYLAIKLRRHGIRVEVASVAANLGHISTAEHSSRVARFRPHRPCRLSQWLTLLSGDKQAKVKLMGHNKGRDNAKKRAKRRKKTERLALAGKKQETTK